MWFIEKAERFKEIERKLRIKLSKAYETLVNRRNGFLRKLGYEGSCEI